MTDLEKRLTPPETFKFPFPPYDIQEQFMTALFNTLEGGKLGIFESPTGTGKSLSLICGALTWYLESEAEKKKKLEKLVNDNSNEVDDNDDDWFAAAGRKQQYNQKRLEAKEELERINKREERLNKIQSRRNDLKQVDVDKNKDDFNELFKEIKWIQNAVKKEISQGHGDEEILVDDYLSDDDNDDLAGNDEEEEDKYRRIFFCSRTHSQLSQFVREVKKSPFGSMVQLVSLASRSVMCINPQVRALGSQAAINERCLDLGRRKTKSVLDNEEKPAKRAKKGEGTSCGCPYRKSTSTAVLRDKAILAIHDIEELVIEGRKVSSCPYYASRSALPLSQLVVLPYNSLLHAGTRKALGINLTNSIVIIDEAHNLLDTISNIHSASVSGGQLGMAYSQLCQYKDKYSTRMKARNLLYIKQILFVLSKMIKLLGGTPGKDPATHPTIFVKEETKLVQVADFKSEAEIYNLDLFKLIKYCNISQICQKLKGFVMKYQPSAEINNSTSGKSGVGSFLDSIKVSTNEVIDKKDEKVNDENKPTSVSAPLMSVVELLSCLCLPKGEARMSVTRGPLLNSGGLRFLLLDPAVQFQQVVKEAHSIVVAGGTMRPLQEFKDQLFLAAGADKDRVTSFSCDHVVPGENLMPLVICAGPSGARFEFSYQFRDKKETLDELGRALVNLVNFVPGGMVVFFPSYDYEQLVHSHFVNTGVLVRLESKKKMYREPKNSADLDKVLSDYSNSVRLGGGALLFAVVGGKMSEGINFGDDLGRAVVMVGMPYPNLYSPELKEKMNFLNRTVGTVEGRPAGQVHYENLCMKAVNQSVGRVIRHKDDHASIILLDHRYSRPQVISQLPSWISKHLKVIDKFGPAVPTIRKFFKEKEQLQ